MVKILPIVVALAVQAPPTGSTDSIARTVVAERAGFQAVRVQYRPGAVEPPGEHTYDVVLVPLDDGMTATVDGRAVAWKPGVTILIPRGAPHRIRNDSSRPVTFISIRRLADPEIAPPPSPESTSVTIVRSEESKYVRAVTLRFERGGTLSGPGDLQAGPSLFVLTAGGRVEMTMASTIRDAGAKPAGTVWLFEPGQAFRLANLGTVPIEIVRVSAPPGR